TQTKGPNIKPTALAKMGSMGGDAFTKIISKTSSQGISDLDKIKDNHKGLSLTKGNMFISQPIKFRPEQYDEMVSYMNDIWME